jgi:hypothetical protein
MLLPGTKKLDIHEGHEEHEAEDSVLLPCKASFLASCFVSCVLFVDISAFDCGIVMA